MDLIKKTIIVFITALLVIGAIQSYKLIKTYSVLKSYKEDLAEINKINYGLFNLQIWKKEALNVFENRIGEFEISPKAYDQVVKELDTYLRGLNRNYVENGKIFEKIFEDAEKNPKTNRIFLKLIKENAGIQIKNLDIPKYIPGMAIELANELKKQEPQLRDIMRTELKKIIKDDATNRFADPRQKIFDKYNTFNLENTNNRLTGLISEIQLETTKLVQWTYGILVTIFLLSWLLTVLGENVAAITLITLDSILLLILGVNLPMIDIEAILNAFTINVLGTDIGFEKQYMYYQSKSILNVTETLIQGKGLDLKIVGWMVLCFSVIFPFIKLVLSAMYLYSSKVRNQKFIRNIIFYLGKWSMADVFVVALFMAYIGFYGIISSQLNSIARNEGGFAVETLNNSGLAPGALFFTTYCILSVIVGILINKKVSIGKNTDA